jgi:hypothetical protein
MYKRDIFSLIELAESVHAKVAVHGYSKDAILSAITMLHTSAEPQPGSAPRPRRATLEPPPWFLDACERLKGRRLSVGQFIMLAGQPPAGKRQANQVGQWLRDAGRHPRKSNGAYAYDL